MFKFPPFLKKFEFLIKLAVFALCFYYTLDYIFICEVNNILGLSTLVFVVILIVVIQYFFGRKNKCPSCNK